MANENNGVFTNLLIAVGAPIQNVADAVTDTIGSGLSTANSIAQSGLNLAGTVATSSVNTATQFLEGVSTAVTAAITSAITPKK